MRVWFLPLSSRSNPYQSMLAEHLSTLGVRTNRVPGGAESGAGGSGEVDFRARPRRGDVIHVHWIDQLILGRTRIGSVVKGGLFLCRVARARLAGTRLVWTAHNLRSHDRLFPALEWFMTRMFARQCHAIIVHFDGATKLVRRYYRLGDGPSFELIPHPGFGECYPTSVNRAEARRRLGYGRVETVFLSFGKIRPYKEVERLVDTFRNIGGADTRLLVAGSPRRELRPGIAERAGGDQRIKMNLEHIDDERVPEYFLAADVFVLSASAAFTSGSAVLAMSFGLPVVGPRGHHLCSVLGPDYPLLYRPSERGGLRHALQKALEVNLVSLGSQCRQAVEGFTWQEAAKKTAAVYRGALG